MIYNRNVTGTSVKMENQPPEYDGTLLCPMCECQATDADWEQIDGYMRVRCVCCECDASFEIWYVLKYVEHREIECQDT